MTTPEYGYNYIKSFCDDIEIRDYSKTTCCLNKYPTSGIMVLGYDTDYNISYSIKYLPPRITSDLTNEQISVVNHVTDRLTFSIEIEGHELILRSTWDVSEVDESTYEYYLFLLNKVRNDIKETRSHARTFGSKSWIKRNKQLNAIIN